jgi:single-stranded-DNA-specific exonuclease
VRKWIEPREIAVPQEFRSAVGGHPLVAQSLVRCGLTDVLSARAFLDPRLYSPAPASDLPNLVGAVERLERAIRDGEEICVWGDFDVDGQTATTVLFSTLRDLGASVRYHIPVRATESHGVGLPVLKRLIAEGVQLVLTCDTGVGAHEATSYAREAGVDVVITDHHDLPDVLPDAHAVVNPKMLPESHPLRELPGVGCAYKVAEALYERAGRSQEVEHHLDLLALGIVADVAVQTKDVRFLLQRGLEALCQTARLGLQALMEKADLNPEWLTEEHIGFYLAPRLNAVGRLADASVAVELLATKDLSRARILAEELEGLNARRRLLSDQVFEAAVEQVERDPSLLDQGALVLNHAAWPAGVIGIVASRLVERYGLPTVLLASPPGELARGSARSIEGCNITEAIAAHAELLAGFGGHPMAAGLSMETERIPEFRRGLSSTVSQMLEGVEDGSGLPVAGYLSLSELSLDLVRELERLAPFGAGNPAPTLATRDLRLVGKSKVGRKGEHLQLVVEDADGVQARIIWWHGTSWTLPEGRFDLAYKVRASDFRGQRELQVQWVDARLLEPRVEVPLRERVELRVVDRRGEPEPRAWLEQLRAREEVQVWAEAAARGEVDGADRYELEPSRALVIWTTPPGWRELQGALDKVAPEIVYLIGLDTGMDDPQQFLKRLAGLVKRALSSQHEGRVSLRTLAAATAQRAGAVRLGLDWLVEHGHISTVDDEGEQIVVAVGSGRAGDDATGATQRLRALLEETAAYRRHFARAPADILAQR